MNNIDSWLYGSQWDRTFDRHMFKIGSNTSVSYKFCYQDKFEEKHDMLIHINDSEEKTIARLVRASRRARKNSRAYWNNIMRPFRKTILDANGYGRAYVFPRLADLPVDGVMYYEFDKWGTGTRWIREEDCAEEIGWDIISNSVYDPDDPQPGNIYDKMEQEHRRLTHRFSSLYRRLVNAVERYVRDNYDDGPITEIVQVVFDGETFVYDLERAYLDDDCSRRCYLARCKPLYDTICTPVNHKVIRVKA